MMRFSVLLLLGLLGGGLPAEAGTAILRVWTSYRAAESFETLGELLGKGETTGGRVLARTQPQNRDGFYFLVRVKNEEGVQNGEVKLELIMPGSDRPVARTFPVSLQAGQFVLQLGITGSDWPGARIKPVAWRVTVSGASGAQLAQRQSFLWGQS